MLFSEIETQGTDLEQVVISIEQCLDGPINDALIQEFIEQEAATIQHVKVARSVRSRIGQT
jgi:hypothetical protein